MNLEKNFENIENEKEIIKLILEDLILESQELGRGSNGVVFKLDMSQDSFYDEEHITKEDWREYLKDVFNLPDEIIEEIIENPSAGKILKVYRPGLAIAEFNGQANVYNMTKDLDETKYAKVPKAFFAYDMQSISDRLHEKMNFYGIGSKSLDIFFMEFADAIELKEYIYKKIIDNCEDFHYLKNGDDYETKETIYKEIDSRLDILSNLNTQFETKLNKIVDFLKENNIKIEDEILDMVENTIKYLNNELNVFHNDVHLKNILIKKMSDNSFRAWLIDWATVSRGPKSGRIQDDLLTHALRRAKYTA